MPFLDTNIIVRFITQDAPEQAQRAALLFEQLGLGNVNVTTSEAVIVETVQVLSSRALYNLPRAEIQTHLTNILSLRGLVLSNKRTYLRALEIYASTNVDFVDALNVAHMERAGIDTIMSFDRDFDRIPGIQRVEP